MCDVPATCVQLQAQQRQRAVFLKSRNMVANRLLAVVAGFNGYHSGMAEKDREKAYADARKLVAKVEKGGDAGQLTPLIATHLVAINSLEAQMATLEKSMKALAKSLPVASWVEAPEQRGFGLLMLAIVIGETGDLANYSNPGKVWRRLGCAPFESQGEVHMGSTWKRGKGSHKLSGEEWEEFGYSPRRRSIAYLIGDGLVKQNGRGGDSDPVTETPATSAAKNKGTNGERYGDTDCCAAKRPKSKRRGGTGETRAVADVSGAGPYRRRYEETKATWAAKHPDEKPMHAHLHGMLLATKRLLRNLWREWNPAIAAQDEYSKAERSSV